MGCAIATPMPPPALGSGAVEGRYSGRSISPKFLRETRRSIPTSGSDDGPGLITGLVVGSMLAGSFGGSDDSGSCGGDLGGDA